ncbi:MAG: 30S ribosomal protein S1 [Defluviicoccus sp.]|nr:30S ribosomal protein S1 [Defluviicoccus sp.]
MLEESFAEREPAEGSVVKGIVISIENDSALVDVGLKSEGRVALKEFAAPGQEPELKVGDSVDVYLERMEDRNGEAVLSRERARREEAWTLLEKAFNAGERVSGTIFGRVKGGFTVDLSGAVAFLPGSQVDVRPVRDVSPLMGTPQPFQILKMDRRRGNIVVSRRAVLEESRAEARNELLANLKERQILEGIVKNITDYGAFVDLGGVDGLLHVTDIAWRRINHPSDALSIGQTVKVQVIRYNPETQRISLGMKQLEADPWDGVEHKYPVGVKFTGRVSNITDYGAFVELEPGVEGLVHVSEMSWTKKNVHPGKIVSTSKNITEFGLFIGLDSEIDGMVHLSDIDWARPGEEALRGYKKGDLVKARVLDVDPERERISLGIKQLEEDKFEVALENVKRGDVLTCTVSQIVDNGVEVTVAGGLPGFIRRAELARDRADQRPDRFAPGDRVDARVTNIDRRDRKLTLSIKAQEVAEEKQAMAEFGSSDSGASLGDILGAAISRANRERAEREAAGAGTESEDAPAEEQEAASPDGGEAAKGDAGAAEKDG